MLQKNSLKKWTSLKLKNLLLKIQLKEEIFAKYLSDQWFVSRIYKELLQPKKKTNNLKTGNIFECTLDKRRYINGQYEKESDTTSYQGNAN